MKSRKAGKPDPDVASDGYRQKRMRSGPATRTAFASVNPASAFSRAFRRFCSFAFQRLRQSGLATGDASAHWAHPHQSCSAVAVPLGGTVSEEAATPGLPATLARFGNRFSKLPRPLTGKTFRLRLGAGSFALAAEPPLTITGSATFTLAVNELSRISFRAATGIRAGAVRNLWTLRLPCGKGRKRRGKIEIP